MAAKTKLTTKQGATYIIALQADDGVGANYTGWTAKFIVKKTLNTANADALFNVSMSVDPVDGTAEYTFTDEVTALWEVGAYVYGAVLIDNLGNVAKTDNGEFIVEPTAYIGAIA